MCGVYKMIHILLFFCLASVLGRNIIPKGSRILNGQDAVQGQFPYQVTIIGFSPNVDIVPCTGAIISDQWILTSAHCVNGALVLVIDAGIVDISVANGQIEIAGGYIIHEDFDPTTLQNDIAVVSLDYPLEFNDNVKPITLAEEELPASVSATISGWGYSANDSPTNTSLVLQYATVTTIDNSRCQEIYGADVVSARVVCAIGEDPIRNPCLGDGGAPLVTDIDTNPVHVGIFSFISSVGCDQGYPAGYTRTAAHRNWIRETTGV